MNGGYQRARDSAWGEWGRRHYRGVIAFEISRKAAPAVFVTVAVAALLYGGVAVARHIDNARDAAPPVDAANTTTPTVDTAAAGVDWTSTFVALGVVAVVVAVFAAVAWWHPGVFRTVGRKAAAALTALGAGIVAYLWMGTT